MEKSKPKCKFFKKPELRNFGSTRVAFNDWTLLGPWFGLSSL
jgi:hypothetical protein